MSAAPLLVSREGAVLTLTLNRPEKRNALNEALIAGLRDALAGAALESDVRCVMVRGSGGDFCAGADLQELLDAVGRDPAENAAAALRLGEVFVAIRELPKPVVAVVQGRALAGGCGLATACDIVLAARDATFGYPEIQRGFVPAMVMAILRRLTGEKRAFDLVATGRVLTASEALESGLVSRVVEPGDLEREALTLSQTLSGASANAMGLVKKQMYELDGRSFREGIELGARVNALARSHPDFELAVRRFFSK